MSEIVFILRAGASKHTEAPFMKDFFNDAEDLYLSGAFQGEDGFYRSLSSIKDIKSELIKEISKGERAS